MTTTTKMDNLFLDSKICAESWLFESEKAIDSVFGVGFAKNHPELVEGYINAASNAFIALQVEEAGKIINGGLRSISSAKRSKW